MDKTDELPLEPRELATIAKSRAAFYSLLNVHFITLPDVEFVGRIRDGEFTSVLDSLTKEGSITGDMARGAGMMRDYVDKTRDDQAAQLSERLGVDRTRLYRGVAPGYGPPPPYESVWSGSGQGTAVLLAVAAVYREAGLARSPEATERIDYIGVELDFMRELALREAAAWDSGALDTAQQSLKAQHGFINEHLRWVPIFVEKALEQAETDFYKGHLLLLRQYLTEDQERLQALLEEVAPEPSRAQV
jgi:putative dimethyl sulfoxide reductase chaperone